MTKDELLDLYFKSLFCDSAVFVENNHGVIKFTSDMGSFVISRHKYFYFWNKYFARAFIGNVGYNFEIDVQTYCALCIIYERINNTR